MEGIDGVVYAGGLAYRSAGQPGGRTALLVHGYPESSFMWRHALAALAQGEQLIDSYTREGFAGAMGALCAGIGEDAVTESWKGFADETRRAGQLELYRSGDFEKLAPYEGRVAALGLPTLVLWGAQDNFAGVAMAERFHREIADSQLTIVEGAGHFVWEDAPQQTSERLRAFVDAAF